MNRLATSYVNLARVMLILDLWSDGEYRRGMSIFRTLDRRSARKFRRDLVDRLRPWMYWLGIPLTLANIGINYMLKPVSMPNVVAGAASWILVFATPFVLINCLWWLLFARLLNISIERRLTDASFNRALLMLSFSAYGAAALLGAVGSLYLPEVFLVLRQ